MLQLICQCTQFPLGTLLLLFPCHHSIVPRPFSPLVFESLISFSMQELLLFPLVGDLIMSINVLRDIIRMWMCTVYMYVATCISCWTIICFNIWLFHTPNLTLLLSTALETLGLQPHPLVAWFIVWSELLWHANWGCLPLYHAHACWYSTCTSSFFLAMKFFRKCSGHTL